MVNTYLVIAWCLLCPTTADDYDIVRERYWRAFLPPNDDRTFRKVDDVLDLMDSSGKFVDIEYDGDTRSLTEHGSRLTLLAWAWYTNNTDNDWSQSPYLLEKFELSLNYLTYTSPRNLDPSWYDVKINVPTSISGALILMANQIPYDLLIETLDRFFKDKDVWDPTVTGGTMGGSNFADRAYLALIEELLRGRNEFTQRHTEVNQWIEKELVQREGNIEVGLQPDNCLHQHNLAIGNTNEKNRHMMYNGNYVGILASLAPLTGYFKNTAFQLSDMAIKSLVEALLDCQQWLGWNYAYEPTSTGRKIAKPGKVAYFSNSVATTAAKELLHLHWRQDEMEKIIRREGQTKQAPGDALVGFQHFFTSDMVVLRRLDFMVALRLLSDRTCRPETWEKEGLNEFGYFLGDGFVTVFQTGEELGEYENEIFVSDYDWLHLPGVTIEYTGDIPVVQTSRKDWPHNVNSASFVGGVTDGQRGAAAMVYDRPTVNITAVKGYFFFDNEVVLLIAEINAENTEYAHPIHTTLNQVVQKGDVTVRVDDDTLDTLSSGMRDYESPRWLLHDNLGYVFLRNIDNVKVQATDRTGQSVFQAYIDHGTIPKANTAYILKPNTRSTESLDNYILNLPVTILNNTNKIQAVMHRDLNSTEAIFYESGVLILPTGTQISVSHRCMVMVVEGSDYHIAVSTPDQPGIILKLVVNRKLGGEGAVYDPQRRETTVSFAISNNRFSGKSIARVFTLVNW